MPEPAPFEVWFADGMPIVTGPAEIDISNAGELRAALLSAASGHPTIVVDLSRTEFCDSSGLNVLVRAMKRAQASGGELRLVVSAPSVVRILAVTGVDNLFRTFATLSEALTEDRPASA